MLSFTAKLGLSCCVSSCLLFRDVWVKPLDNGFSDLILLGGWGKCAKMCFFVDLSQLQDFMPTRVKNKHVYSRLLFTKKKNQSTRKGVRGWAPRAPPPSLATPQQFAGTERVVSVFDKHGLKRLLLISTVWLHSVQLTRLNTFD